MELLLLHHRSSTQALTLLDSTVLRQSVPEHLLIKSYQHGERINEQALDLRETSLYQLVYESQTTPPLPKLTQLRDILLRSRCYNTEHHITGLLLCSEGRFVQLLEGTEADVQELFAAIKQDRRHKQVQLLHQGVAQKRCFPEWSMGFGQVPAADLNQLIRAIQVRQPVRELCFKDPCLQALWQAVRVAGSNV
ncbi:BLUF domain-containing protein [Hymenobacter volaticus]|uniref:BLUF domain-containing protein n=1 Tax=Hymenobacter volaticus TaxID=2932254 RepID=A0ABY4GDU4_9BACT|nr:BLUF domain-containing protein [Hymenobacter volaticus]UOQ68734.1 BLUF domain-containing protein [Hymenobacter volaticus]